MVSRCFLPRLLKGIALRARGRTYASMQHSAQPDVIYGFSVMYSSSCGASAGL